MLVGAEPIPAQQVLVPASHEGQDQCCQVELSSRGNISVSRVS